MKNITCGYLRLGALTCRHMHVWKVHPCAEKSQIFVHVGLAADIKDTHVMYTGPSANSPRVANMIGLMIRKTSWRKAPPSSLQTLSCLQTKTFKNSTENRYYADIECSLDKELFYCSWKMKCLPSYRDAYSALVHFTITLCRGNLTRDFYQDV